MKKDTISITCIRMWPNDIRIRINLGTDTSDRLEQGYP